MSALLESRVNPAPEGEISLVLRERVTDWGDPTQVAQIAAELLHAKLRRPVVSIYRREETSGDLVLHGHAPQKDGRSPTGSRGAADHGVLEALVREGTRQRSLNYYVKPDFVRSLPGETRSALALPIAAGSRLLGAIHLEYSSPHTPTAEHEADADPVVGLLSAAWGAMVDGRPAGSTGTAVERKLREASTLAGITSGLAQAEDFSGMQLRITEAAGELLGCGGVAVLMKHASRQMLEVLACSGTPAIPLHTLIPIDGTLPGQVARSGKPVHLRDGVGPAEPVLPASVLDRSVRDAVIVPITAGGRTSGVLLAIDSPKGTGFSPDDVQLLQALADNSGVVEAVRTIPPLRQRISDASLIAEVGRAMTGTLGLDDVLALILRAAEMLVSGRYAAVALLSEDRAVLELAATSGTLREQTGAVLFPRENVLGWVALGGECLITDSLSDDGRGWPLGEGFGPAAIVPLESRGQILGVLVAGRASNAASLLSDDDLDALRKLAAYGAIAIDNARLYREQTELSRTLTLQATELEKAYAELHSSQERLLVSEKMAALGRVTAGIAHEINSPLGSILNCLQLATNYAQEYRDSATDPEVTPDDHVGIATDLLESLGLAEEATRRVGQFVRTIKGQTRMDEEKVLPFDPAEESERTMNLIQHELDTGQISLEADFARGLRLDGDSSKFALIVQNLVSNAVDAYEGSAGVVRIRLFRNEDAIVLEVEDEGSGIPEDIRPRIFDYLFTTKDVGRGTGLGLSLVHSTATSHFRGTVDFRSEVGAGTTFVVTFPLRAEN